MENSLFFVTIVSTKELEVNKDSLWQAVLGEVELTVSRASYMTWFKNTCLLKLEDELVVVGVSSVFVKQQMEQRYNTLVVETLKNNGIVVENIEYKITPLASNHSSVATTNSQSSDSPNMQTTTTTTMIDAEPVATTAVGSSTQGLNERYTLDNFVVGASNELAFAACQAIIQQPGTKYNPLYLYGGVGIGKTHLMQAVGNALAAQTPSAKILYINTEQFVKEFVDALRTRKTAEFANYYRSADVLIVDDVQFIAGKDKMEEEFFHTFNTLHQNNRQIIISSDKPPKDIPTIEDRLRSRLAWGMSIDMQIPDFETRCAIVQAKALEHNVSLPNDVVEFLAGNFQSNIRELEGALNQLLAYCEMRGLGPDIAIAKAQLNVSRVRPKHLSARQIIERTAKHFRIPMEDILGPKRDKDIVVPRQIAMYMLRSELHLSFPKIAKELGRKDHTTAIHSVDKIAREATQDASLRMALAEIKEYIYA